MSGNSTQGDGDTADDAEPPYLTEAERLDAKAYRNPLSPDQNCFALVIGVGLVFFALLACFIYFILNVDELKSPKPIADPVPPGIRAMRKAK